MARVPDRPSATNKDFASSVWQKFFFDVWAWIKSREAYIAALIIPTRGNSVDLSGLAVKDITVPAWVTRITLGIAHMSTNGSSAVIVQIGAGTPDTTGYEGSGSDISGTVVTTGYTVGLGTASGTGSAAYLRNGQVSILNMGANLWSMVSSLALSNQAATQQGASSHSTAGQLTVVRVTTQNGTDLFDAGSQVSYFFE